MLASCPRCDSEAHLSVSAGEAAIGTLSPAPPVFRPERRAQIAGLAVDSRFDHLAVALAARSWLFER